LSVSDPDFETNDEAEEILKEIYEAIFERADS